MLGFEIVLSMIVRKRSGLDKEDSFMLGGYLAV